MSTSSPFKRCLPLFSLFVLHVDKFMVSAVEGERGAFVRTEASSSPPLPPLPLPPLPPPPPHPPIFSYMFSLSWLSSLILLFPHCRSSPLLSPPCLTTFWLAGAADKHFCWICHSHLASLCGVFLSLFFCNPLPDEVIGSGGRH